MDINKCENKKTKSPCKDDVPHCSKSQITNETESMKKVKSAHNTPNKVDNPSYDETSCTNEKPSNSPHKIVNFNQKNLLKSPYCLRSQITNETESTKKTENAHSTPNKVDNPSCNDTSCTNEKLSNSPHKNVYFNKKNLLKSPYCLKSQITSETESMKKTENVHSTPNKVDNPSCTNEKLSNSPHKNVYFNQRNLVKSPYCLKSQLPNETESTKKIESAHSTPNKVDKPNCNDTSYTIDKPTNSPHKNVYFNQKNLLKSPYCLRSQITNETESTRKTESAHNTPDKVKNPSCNDTSCTIDKPTNSPYKNINCDQKNLLNNSYCLRSRIINETESMNKTENVHSTSNKVDNSNCNNTTCTNEKSSNSPYKNVNFNQKNLLKSPLFKSPIIKKWDKSPQSGNTSPRKRKRTISTNSDYDIFKSELYNTENCSNIENIELLHDLNSIVMFDSNDCVSMMDINMMQEDYDLLGVNKDVATDPLSISDCEKKDIDTATDSKITKRVESKSQVKTRKSKHLKRKKYKMNMDEEHILEELEKSKVLEEIPLTDIKKLQELHIKLIHEVPPQHKIELSGSHAPTKKEKMLFQKHGPIRRGFYRSVEDKIIRKNWQKFCKLHDWDTKKTELFLHWRHKNKYYIQDMRERQRFVQFLANGLPWRTLYSVYCRFKILYHKKITHTRYTSAEDDKILMYIENKHLAKRKTKYNELALLLKRTSRSIVKRYNYLIKQIQNESETEPLNNVKWTLPLIKKFIKTLLNVTLSEDINELKGAIIPIPVWRKMEEKLNIKKDVLRTFWQHQLHLQLFRTDPIYLNDIKIQLIEYIYAKGISDTREVIWSNVAKHFDGATAEFLCKIFNYLIQECDTSDMDNFTDIVEHLYHIKIPEIQNAPTDRFLPKILYKNGKICLL